jgi:predicted dinucleotide-binding enzyme
VTARNDTLGIAGAGAFGTALAYRIGGTGRPVLLWSSDADVAAQINRDHTHPRLGSTRLPDVVRATTDPAELAQFASFLVIAVTSSEVRRRMRDLGDHLDGSHMLVSAIGALAEPDDEPVTGVLRDETPCLQLGVLAGPALPRDLVAGGFNSMVCASHYDRVTSEARRRCRRHRTCGLHRARSGRGRAVGGARRAYTIAIGMADCLRPVPACARSDHARRGRSIPPGAGRSGARYGRPRPPAWAICWSPVGRGRRGIGLISSTAASSPRRRRASAARRARTSRLPRVAPRRLPQGPVTGARRTPASSPASWSRSGRRRGSDSVALEEEDAGHNPTTSCSSQTRSAPGRGRSSPDARTGSISRRRSHRGQSRRSNQVVAGRSWSSISGWRRARRNGGHDRPDEDVSPIAGQSPRRRKRRYVTQSRTPTQRASSY